MRQRPIYDAILFISFNNEILTAYQSLHSMLLDALIKAFAIMQMP
jgi:hypothetical protein